MPTLQKPSWMTWGQVARRVWSKVLNEDVTGRSAELAYYFFLAVFPLLICVLQIFSAFPAAAHHLRLILLQLVGGVLPYSAADLISKTMDEIENGSRGAQITAGVLVYLWSASTGMMAAIDATNAAYGIRDSRSYLKQRALAAALTVAAGLLLAGVSVVLVLGSDVARDSQSTSVVFKAAEWVLVAVSGLLILAIVYYFAPDVTHRSWRWITPGSVLAVVLCLVGSAGFRIYLHFFNSYSATYGSLGAVIILLLWFYLAGMAVLVGAELNGFLETAANAPAAGDASQAAAVGKSRPAPAA